MFKYTITSEGFDYFSDQGMYYCGNQHETPKAHTYLYSKCVEYA